MEEFSNHVECFVEEFSKNVCTDIGNLENAIN